MNSGRENGVFYFFRWPNECLDFSKIEAGKIELNYIDFDLLVLLEELNDLLLIRDREKGLKYIFRIAPGVPLFVFGDPGRLRQIMINLIGNAIKFTKISLNYRLEGAIDAATAFTKLKEGAAQGAPFDIAIIDNDLPDMVNESLGRLIKEIKALSQIRLIVMTSIGFRGDASRFQAGVIPAGPHNFGLKSER